jgi:NAD(P)H dehydrogenase (quinone)
MTRQPVLVTGATGDTGGYAIDALRKLDVPIRAMAHKDDDQAARLRAVGAEVVLGDLLYLDSVRAAMEGVSAAYFVYPLLPGLIDATAYFAQAAREADLGGVVNMSQISARRHSKSIRPAITGSPSEYSIGPAFRLPIFGRPSLLSG